MTTEQSDGACTPCAKGMEMSKCREAFEKQYGEDFNPDHSPVASVWQAAWNARGKVDAEICDRFDFCGNEILIAEAIEAAVLEAHGKQEPVAWMHWYKYYDGTDVVKVAIGHAPTFNDQSPFRSEPLYAAPVVQPDMAMVPQEVIEKIEQWSRAYPTDIFPEPDFEKVREALEGSGITLDSVSASNMRHVITGVWKMISAAEGKSNAVADSRPD